MRLSIYIFISCRSLRNKSRFEKSGRFARGRVREFSSSNPSKYKSEQPKKSASLTRLRVQGREAQRGDSQQRSLDRPTPQSALISSGFKPQSYTSSCILSAKRFSAFISVSPFFQRAAHTATEKYLSRRYINTIGKFLPRLYVSPALHGLSYFFSSGYSTAISFLAKTLQLFTYLSTVRDATCRRLAISS